MQVDVGRSKQASVCCIADLVYRHPRFPRNGCRQPHKVDAQRSAQQVEHGGQRVPCGKVGAKRTPRHGVAHRSLDPVVVEEVPRFEFGCRVCRSFGLNRRQRREVRTCRRHQHGVELSEEFENAAGRPRHASRQAVVVPRFVAKKMRDAVAKRDRAFHELRLACGALFIGEVKGSAKVLLRFMPQERARRPAVRRHVAQDRSVETSFKL